MKGQINNKEEEKMREYKKSIYGWSIRMITVGIILILGSKIFGIGTVVQKILEFTGVTFLGVFAVSLIFQIFAVEKYYNDFKRMLTEELKEMDSIQSKCIKLGIKEVFETHKEYTRKYPFEDIINNSPDGSEIMSVGRSLLNLLMKKKEFKEALKKGMKIKLACALPDAVDSAVEEITDLHKEDIEPGLIDLQEILSYAKEKKLTGSLEFKYHRFPVIDSALIFTTKDEQTMIWSLVFGRTSIEKSVIMFDVCPNSLGEKLKKRYDSLWKSATSKLIYSNGSIEKNELLPDLH